MVEPQPEIVPFDDLVLKRLDRITGEIESLKSSSIRPLYGTIGDQIPATSYIVVAPRRRADLNKVKELIEETVGYSGDIVGPEYKVPFSYGTGIDKEDVEGIVQTLNEKGLNADVMLRHEID